MPIHPYSRSLTPRRIERFIAIIDPDTFDVYEIYLRRRGVDVTVLVERITRAPQEIRLPHPVRMIHVGGDDLERDVLVELHRVVREMQAEIDARAEVHWEDPDIRAPAGPQSTPAQPPRTLMVEEPSAPASTLFVRARGWTIAETFLDQGISGTKERRPSLDRMLTAARRRKFDAIITYKSDRLFRSVKHMVNTLDELGALGVAYVSATEPLDTTTPTGKLLFHIVAAMSEFERSLLVERTKAGLAAARKRGARFGRPRVHVDVDRALDLRGRGMSLRAVAQEMKVGTGTLHRALHAVGVPM